MGRLVKYMGTADVVRLERGEDFGGRLAEPLTKDVQFDKDNRWVIDAQEAGLSDEAVELLLDDKERFKDVTDLKKIPTNAHQRTFMAMGANEDDSTAEGVRTASEAGDKVGGADAGADDVSNLVDGGDAQATSGGTGTGTTAGGSGDDAGATAAKGTTGGRARGGGTRT